MLTKVLTILTDNYYRVLALFTVMWDSLVNTVNNVWKWITDATSNVINWTQAQFASLSNWVTARWNELSAWVNQVTSETWKGVSSWALGEINKLGASFNFLILTVRSDFDNIYNGLKMWVMGQISGISTTFTPLINALRGELISLVSPLTSYTDFIKTLFTLFTPDNRTKILQLLQDGFNNLTTFIQNPIGFTTGFLWSIFIDFASFSLAYALGTTKYDLPPIPQWGGQGGVIVNPGENPPPPGASGLTPPITPLYVSGYTFTPTHLGTDFGLQDGQAMFACHAGQVIEAGFSSVGYGNTIVIQGEHWRSRYGHLKILFVSVGQTVNQGDEIGLGNSTGNSTGPHLHLELRYDGVAIDPLLCF